MESSGKAEVDEEREVRLCDVSWDAILHVLSFCSARDIIRFSATCKEYRPFSTDTYLWRNLLIRDFGRCDGMAGFDILRKEQNELFLSSSNAAIDFYDAPWTKYYRDNFSLVQDVSPVWGPKFQAEGMTARQCHTCSPWRLSHRRQRVYKR